MTQPIPTQVIKFSGSALSRGFWLYIWEITTDDGKKLHYVGRTGDAAIMQAQSPFNRMGQHLGHRGHEVSVPSRYPRW